MGLERSDYLRQQYDCYSSHVVQACDHKSWKLIRSYKLMKYGSQHKIIGGILVEKEMIIVLDFGGQYNQLIARRVRECNVYCEVHPYTLPLEKIKEMNPKGIIFTGGPNSVYKEESPRCSKEIFDLGIPVLGICYGAQLMSYLLGGEVATAPVSEYGKTEVEVDTTSKLYEGVSPKTICWMSHTDYISKMPEGFRVTAHTPVCPIAGMENEEKGWYGIQAHPEVLHTQEGSKMLHNFVYSVCHCAGDWKMDAFVEKSIEEIRKKVGNGRALLALSGGVDSSVAGVLMAKAIGDQLTCVFVDHGLLRKNEGDEVEAVFGPNGPYKLNFIRVNAQQRFYDKLAGVTDPERKRKIIGEEFIRVFEEEAKKIGKVDYFVQGTIYPDVIESSSVNGPSQTIKSHHNVGGLPDYMKLKIVEPLRLLFKDEVRRVGKSLGLADKFLKRHPFPGPGLAIRILGEITKEKVRLLQEADYIYISMLQEEGLYDKVWQAGTILLPIKSVGVMGDERTYESVVALRAVESTDGMTADWCHLPYEFLAKVSNKIINNVRGINRVVYDISSKPPATIEWE